MLTSKFDLYRTEWLDLVFDDRNKNYGAYELRQTYAGTMVKAMGFTFLAIGLLCATLFYLNSGVVIDSHTPVDITPPFLPQVVPAIKEVKPPATLKHQKPIPVIPPAATTKLVTVVPAPDPLSTNPPKNAEITNAVGPETTAGTPTLANAPVVDVPKGPPGSGESAPDESVHSTRGLEFMPEPVGGASAWAKFLNKNLRFPFEAQQEGLGGRVMLSFIIEKDGHLSNIVVDNGAGHGFDEEALRVLKLAKAWKPGIKNGQPVRVKYSIPINFQLSE